jgi:CO/xanthine dehydrogenase Mo-binding subunit
MAARHNEIAAFRQIVELRQRLNRSLRVLNILKSFEYEFGPAPRVVDILAGCLGLAIEEYVRANSTHTSLYREYAPPIPPLANRSLPETSRTCRNRVQICPFFGHNSLGPRLSTDPIVGTSRPRKEGRDKVSGRARYIDDLSFPNMLYGATVRSSIPRGKIKKINFDPRIAWNEFVIVTAKDIPGKNHIALIENDQPCLADGAVNHQEEAILLLAHPDQHALPKAVAAVSIEYEPLQAVFTIEESERQSEIIWGADNTFKRFLIQKGDVDSVWEKADHIVEGEYFTGAQEQLYIETNGVIASHDPDQGLTVWGSLQCPYYVHKALMPLCDLPEDKVRIVQAETGGAFGGKEEYPSMIAGHAALLAMKSGRPVKIIYDRAEDMAATTKRHPSRTRHRTALDKNGKILGGEIEFVIDGGAYCTLSPVVLSRGTIHAGGPYNWPHVRISTKAVATNAPPHGAFRGFGAPQCLFAMERHMDRIARAVNLSPVEIRRRNFLKQGDTTTTEQVINEPVDLDKLLDRALTLADYEAKKRQFAITNKRGARKKGIGIAAFLHGAGFTGSGERYLASVVGAEGLADGTVRVLVSSTEFGQGTNTVLCQIAAEALGLPYENVSIAQPDTFKVPNSGPTVASRTAMVVGKLVASAALGLKQTLIGVGLLDEKCTAEEFRAACVKHVAQHGEFRSLVRYEQPKGIFWDDLKYRGEAYAAFAWAVYIAEVTVDLTTYAASVDDFVALQEIGRVLNPVLARGQILGGVAQGIGFALYEKVEWRDGRMQNSQMTNYIIPTSADLPQVRVYFEELGNTHGAFGAKGIGELPMDGPAPAVVNAIVDALDIPFDSVPLLPEDIFAGVDAAAQQQGKEQSPVGAR